MTAATEQPALLNTATAEGLGPNRAARWVDRLEFAHRPDP
jgi:hypothetical protein